MARIAYANGVYAPVGAPLISVEDRGYQFADGVYEVVLAVEGKLWDAAGHFARWRRSLSELGIPPPMDEPAMRCVIRAVLRRNRLSSALVYMQATRGVAPRDHVFPRIAKPSFVVCAKPFSLAASDARAEKGVALLSVPDIRWARVDIKSISLLPNVMAKSAASEAGAAEALLHRDGVVTEGGSTNAWIVDDAGAVRTHPLSNRILSGVTRVGTIEAAEALGVSIIEEPFSIEEAKAAKEAFITSASGLVLPVTKIDSTTIGDGRPGPVARALRAAYVDRSRRSAEAP